MGVNLAAPEPLTKLLGQTLDRLNQMEAVLDSLKARAQGMPVQNPPGMEKEAVAPGILSLGNTLRSTVHRIGDKLQSLEPLL